MNQDRPPVLDRFGFPARWQVHTRREIRRVTRALDALPAADHARLDDGRCAAEALAAGKARPTTDSVPVPNRRVVLVLPFPIQTGGMRVQLQLAKMMRDEGAEVHVRQVRGDDCVAGRYDDLGFTSRVPLADPRHLAAALRDLAPATLLVGCWIDYFAAVESGAGPVIGYSAGEPTLRAEPAGFDRSFLDFAYRMHQLPVTLWAGSRSVRNIFRDRFHRTAELISVPIAREMFDRDFAAPPQPPFRVVVVGPEHITTKGIPGALRALMPLRQQGFHIVWISPQAPSESLAHTVDEVHTGLNAEGVAATLASGHALVFPSSVEGLGNPPLEAMALGVPAVLCANGGSAEYAVPEMNCVQVPFGDAEALRAAVCRLRDDPALADRLRTAGRHTAERYRPENIHRTVGEFMAAKFDGLPFVPLGGSS
ncbi:glycosyltransferase family 4 protein [Nocardia sp. BMG51109]|uniref:glycosyltransferase family 4 protein n=1 Tax=Nocardia sp. BMG51109 TaxID=1056816 RepID=UPI000464C43C|nr:glycosyltransferase family 4 protein [Nocardia sp. BMG51109]